MLPDAGKCIAKLRKSGMRIAVVTNQSPVGRGLWDSENLAKIHETLQEMLLLDDPEAIIDLILHSPYPPFYDAWARKPRPGMLEAARQLLDHAESGEEWSNINLKFGSKWMNRPSEESSVMVGDRMSDMEAARSFNVNGLLCPSRCWAIRRHRPDYLNGTIAYLMVYSARTEFFCARKRPTSLKFRLHFWRPDRDLNPGRSLDRAA